MVNRYFAPNNETNEEEQQRLKETGMTWPLPLILATCIASGVYVLCFGDPIKTNTSKDSKPQVYALSEEEKDSLCSKLNSSSMRSVYNDGQCAVLVNKDISSKEALEKILGNGCRVQDILVGKDGRALVSANCQGLPVDVIVKKLQEIQAKRNAAMNAVAMNQRGLGM